MTEPQGDGRSTFCTGLIQAADPVLPFRNTGIGDMILGVPFMRNTYTVMSYSFPEDNGTFPTAPSIDDNGNMESSCPIRPMLGQLPLTDPAKALDEFIMLVCLVGFFALCFLLFGLRWFLIRRRLNQDVEDTGRDGAAGLALGPATDRKEMGGYMVVRRGSREATIGTDGGASKDKLRKLRYEVYIKQTLVGDVGETKLGSDEMGYRNGKPTRDYNNP